MPLEQYVFVVGRYVDAIEERMIACLILMISMSIVIIACFIGVAIVAIKDRLAMRGY